MYFMEAVVLALQVLLINSVDSLVMKLPGYSL